MIDSTMNAMGEGARRAARALALTTDSQRNEALLAAAAAIATASLDTVVFIESISLEVSSSAHSEGR